MLKALYHDCPVDIKVVDEIKDSPKYVEWNKEDSVLYIRKGLELKEEIPNLITELSRANLEETGNTSIDNFKSLCASYLVCRKYNINTDNYEINIPKEYEDFTISDAKKELNDIRNTMESINDRVNKFFSDLQKEKTREER